jgi:electron transport complex protein RnfE
MCPTLAITNSVRNAIAMGLATTFVLVLTNVIVASVRKVVPNQVRIATFIAIAATAVTVTDYLVKAISIDVYKALGPFLALIVVNCVILARAEAFAAKNTVARSFMDGLGNGLGFSLGLALLGTVREVLGAGSFLGISLFGPNYEPWVLFLLPPGGFITLAFWLLVFAWYRERKTKAATAAMQEVHS